VSCCDSSKAKPYPLRGIEKCPKGTPSEKSEKCRIKNVPKVFLRKKMKNEKKK
jgi:hypothetical protein